MAPNFTEGVFKIVSLIEGNPPVGITHTKPAFQEVYLNGSVRGWVVKEEGPGTYRLSVGGYPYTGIDDKKVIASIHARQNVGWRATYRQFQDAYTIEPVDDASKGWTVPDNSKADSGDVVEVKLIIAHHSEPPRYSTSQLFRFAPAYE